MPKQQVTLDRRSGVAILALKHNYFVKAFPGRGSRIKHLLGISRYQREVRNLAMFRKLGLATPQLVAHGHHSRLGLLQEAVLVTREVENAADLEQVLREKTLYGNGVIGARKVLRALALAARNLHDAGFYHKDLKPRNILLRSDNPEPELFFFDCPSGHHPPKFLLHRGIVRDLAHLEEGLRGYVTRIDLLYMYRVYRDCEKLSQEDKDLAREILAYHANRRMTRKRKRREREKTLRG
ncbi:MAG: hypothetical protein GWP63_05520 [Haliea sp.]|nr:hypothetical protein [Haliea sp.]